MVLPCVSKYVAQLERVDREGHEVGPYLSTQALRPFCKKSNAAACLCASSQLAHGLPLYEGLLRSSDLGALAFRWSTRASTLVSSRVFLVTNLSMTLQILFRVRSRGGGKMHGQIGRHGLSLCAAPKNFNLSPPPPSDTLVITTDTGYGTVA